MSQCTIACDLHDYLEIACMYHYQLKCVLKDGQTLEGRAINTITQDKREYLLMDGGDEPQKIELTQLKKLEILTANAKFKEVIF